MFTPTTRGSGRGSMVIAIAREDLPVGTVQSAGNVADR